MRAETLSKISKYLRHYAVPESSFEPVPDIEFAHLLVVPVYDESDLAIERLCTVPAGIRTEPCLIILVFNAPQGGDESARLRTEQSLQGLLDGRAFEALDGGRYLHTSAQNHSILALDYVSGERCLPAKQGVGLARKLGIDSGLFLLAENARRGRVTPSWIHCSDADVVFPDDYFNIAEPRTGQVACIYPFQHKAEPDWEVPIQLYEWRLHYYVEALRWAGSPYAFHTVGSTISLTPEAYATVRGMPRRAGGEDFYLLNKVAKIGSVDTLDYPVLVIAGRPSQRVPFGTGPALQGISELGDPVVDYRLYHPQSFYLLKIFLDALYNVADSCKALALFEREVEAQWRQNLTPGDAEILAQVLARLGIGSLFRHLAKQSCAKPRKVIDAWFDGFVTLKFVHHVRDVALPDVPLAELSKLADWLPSALQSSLNELMKARCR